MFVVSSVCQKTNEKYWCVCWRSQPLGIETWKRCKTPFAQFSSCVICSYWWQRCSGRCDWLAEINGLRWVEHCSRRLLKLNIATARLFLIWEKTISVSHWSCPHFSICLQHSADSSPHLYLHLFLPKAFAFNAHPEIPPSTDCGLRKCTLRWSRPPHFAISFSSAVFFALVQSIRGTKQQNVKRFNVFAKKAVGCMVARLQSYLVYARARLLQSNCVLIWSTHARECYDQVTVTPRQCTREIIAIRLRSHLAKARARLLRPGHGLTWRMHARDCAAATFIVVRALTAQVPKPKSYQPLDSI